MQQNWLNGIIQIFVSKRELLIGFFITAHIFINWIESNGKIEYDHKKIVSYTCSLTKKFKKLKLNLS